MLGWDHLRADARCFRLDRIEAARAGEGGFVLRPAERMVADVGRHFAEV